MQLPLIDHLVNLLDPGVGATTGYTPAAEKAARESGFRNADEMLAWQRNKNVQNGNSPTTGQSKSAAKPEQGSGATQQPRTLADFFNYITNAMGGK